MWFQRDWRGPVTQDEKDRSEKIRDIPNLSGIYLIKSITTGAFYIGATINLHQRCRNHFRNLSKHFRHPLSFEYIKFGLDDLSVYILESDIPIKELKERETTWVFANKDNPLNRNSLSPAQHRIWRS